MVHAVIGVKIPNWETRNFGIIEIKGFRNNSEKKYYLQRNEIQYLIFSPSIFARSTRIKGSCGFIGRSCLILFVKSFEITTFRTFDPSSWFQIQIVGILVQNPSFIINNLLFGPFGYFMYSCPFPFVGFRKPTRSTQENIFSLFVLLFTH